MTPEEQKLKESLEAAQQALIIAMKCSLHMGIQKDIEKAFQLVDGSLTWFVQTHV